MRPKRKTIALDFDGVIHGYSRGWHDGTCYDEPVPGAVEFIRAMMERFNVFILTTREVHTVCQYMQKLGFSWPVELAYEAFPESIFWNEPGKILITNRKLAAEFYLDDRAIRFTGDFSDAEKAFAQRPWNDHLHPK